MNLNTERKTLSQGVTAANPLLNGHVKLRDILEMLFSDISSIDFFIPRLCFDFSETANVKNIDNRPADIYVYTAMLQCTAEFLRIVKNVCHQDVRLMDHIDSIKITSQYRNENTNRLVGGTKTSLHLQGLALDFTADIDMMCAIYDYILYQYMHDTDIMAGKCFRQSAVHPAELIKYYKGAKEDNIQFIHIGFKFIDREYFNRQQ